MQTDEVLQLLREVAAQVIEPRFRALDDDQVMEKRPGDLVTVADHEAEELITARLRSAYPDAAIIGEEAVSADPAIADAVHADHWFTIDPVDGTKNFVHGSPDHAVMVGEVLRGEVVRGWIWQPQHRRGYVAERGAGAWCGETRLLPRTVDGAPAGRTSRRSWVGRSLGTLPQLQLTWACCGVDYPRLAEGATDYLVYGSATPWDHVPGSLLLAEAGGAMGYTDGTPYLTGGAKAPLLAAGTAGVLGIVAPLAGDLV